MLFTMGGKLRSRLQNKDHKLTKAMRKPRLRYIERPGRSIADSLVEKNPRYRLQGGYSRETCPVCFWQKGKGIPFTRENVNYWLDCVVCENNNKIEIIDNPVNSTINIDAGKKNKASFYLGETSRKDKGKSQ